MARWWSLFVLLLPRLVAQLGAAVLALQAVAAVLELAAEAESTQPSDPVLECLVSVLSHLFDRSRL
jgi:hypothetical protein